MTKVHFAVETKLSNSVRARQLSSMFDAPVSEKCRLEWDLELDLETPWNIGLVCGPSGSGKTTLMRELWGEPEPLEWKGLSVIDDFPKGLSTEEVAAVCQAVGFNTIPAWMRPYAVLSNGEKFRVDLARRLIAGGDLIVVDEFTSVVDRQVAQIGAHAVQKYVRKAGKRFVGVTCHHDLVDWLQPDWVMDMATRQFTRRLLQRRPPLSCTIGRIPRAAWSMFAPYHYLTAELHQAAKCYGLWANGHLAAFLGVIWLPISNGKEKGTSICRVSRGVTLPDWQGLGLVPTLVEAVAAAHKAAGKRMRVYPAHPSLVAVYTKRPQLWQQTKEAGYSQKRNIHSSSSELRGRVGGRPCAVFEWIGPAAHGDVGLV